jgi:hypothetical protein
VAEITSPHAVESRTARLRVLLPFYLAVGPESLAPLVYAVDRYRVTVAPPYRALLNGADMALDSPLTPLVVEEGLRPRVATPWPPLYFVDDVPWELANAMQIDFERGTPYDRRPDATDPPIELCFDALNSVLVRLRIATMSVFTRPLQPGGTIWRMAYLGANGLPVGRDPELRTVSARGGNTKTGNIVTLWESVWNAIAGLSHTFRPGPWDTMLLDAFDAIPDMGAAIVLAHTAIEMRIDDALPRLAAVVGLPPEIWRWIDERTGDYVRQPTIVDKLDTLLGWLGGRSLKSDASLWDRYQRLKKARNKFVHEGLLVDHGSMLTVDTAHELLVAAR